MTVLELLFKSRKFWLATFAVVQTVVFILLPQFPDELWQAIDALVVILIASITAEDFAAKWNK